VRWPGNDAALLVVIPAVAVVAAACILWLRSRRAAVTVSAPQSEVVAS
jgi:cytochrome c-type biogenesis protein CcmH/NrfF